MALHFITVLCCIVEACARIFFVSQLYFSVNFISLKVAGRQCGPSYIRKGKFLILDEWEVTNPNYRSFLAKLQERNEKRSVFITSSLILWGSVKHGHLTPDVFTLESVYWRKCHLWSDSLGCPLGLQIKISRSTRLSTLYKGQRFLSIAMLSAAPHKRTFTFPV